MLNVFPIGIFSLVRHRLTQQAIKYIHYVQTLYFFIKPFVYILDDLNNGKLAIRTTCH